MNAMEQDIEYLRSICKTGSAGVGMLIAVNGIKHRVVIENHEDCEYRGFVDETWFGSGRTPKAAITGVLKRLEHLATYVPKTVDVRAVEAYHVHNELKRREAIERSRKR